MNSFQKIFRLAVAVMAFLALTAGSASAVVTVTRTLTAGTVSGATGTEVVVPVTISDPADVGGIAFTITYDPAIFAFVGLEPATAGWTLQDPAAFKVPDGSVLEGVTYYNPYSHAAPYTSATYATAVNATLFYQFNDLKNPTNQPIGRVLVSGASAVPLTGTTLFNARFRINGGVNGTLYPIRLQRSVINNPAAGYAVDTQIPALVGTTTPGTDGKYTSLDFPVIPAVFGITGGITVSTPVYSLGGKVTYEGGANTVGCTATLKKETTPGVYVFNASTLVGATGLYSFTGKGAGNYKLSVNSLNPNFSGFDSTTAIAISNANITNADVVLPQRQPVRLSGTVTAGNIPGLLVKVVNGTTFDSPLMGVYGISATDGTWSSALLPAGGDYHYYLVYGSLHSAADTATFDETQLKTISGTIAGLPGTGGAVTAISTAGRILQTLQVTANGAYTIEKLVPANDYIVSAVGAGLPLTYFDGKTDISQATAVNISAGNATGINFNFVPPESHITGKITDAGQPVNGITVYGFEVNTFALISTTTNALGEYSLSVPKGSYEVFVIKANGKIYYFYNVDGTPTQNESSSVLRTITADGQTVADTNIYIPTDCNKTLSGKVTYRTSTGDPAPNALVAVFTPTKRSLGLTGQDGSYTVGGLCEGTYSVEMKMLTGSYPVQSATVVFGSTDTTKTQSFIVDTGSILSGTVTEANSNPVKNVAGAMVYLKDQTTGSLVGGRIYFSDAAGKYEIRDIDTNGSYTLEVTHPDYRSYMADLVIGSDTTQNVALDKGAFFWGKVTDNAATPNALAGATVIATRAATTPVYTVTNSAGAYSIYGVDAGQNYILIAQKRGYERQAQTLKQPTTNPGTEINFALPLPTVYYTVSGTVKTSATTSPEVSGAIVLVSSTSKNFFTSTTTDTAGAYSVGNLIASTDYKIVVIPPGLPTQESTFTVGPNATKDFTISLGKDIGGTVTGSVVPIPATTKIYVFLYKGTTYKGFRVAATNGDFLFKGLTVDGNDYKVLAVAAGYVPKWYATGTDAGASNATATAIDITGGNKTDANIALSKP